MKIWAGSNYGLHKNPKPHTVKVVAFLVRIEDFSRIKKKKKDRLRKNGNQVSLKKNPCMLLLQR